MIMTDIQMVPMEEALPNPQIGWASIVRAARCVPDNTSTKFALCGADPFRSQMQLYQAAKRQGVRVRTRTSKDKLYMYVWEKRD